MGKLAGIARRQEKRSPMELLARADVSEACGVADDFRGRPGERQVTLLSADVWRQVCAELGRDLPWTTRRANLLIEGMDLPRSPGGIIDIGPVSLKVTMETDPCSRMEEQCAGLRDALRPDWRGGVSCQVIRGGAISVGDPVHIRPGVPG